MASHATSNAPYHASDSGSRPPTMPLASAAKAIAATPRTPNSVAAALSAPSRLTLSPNSDDVTTEPTSPPANAPPQANRSPATLEPGPMAGTDSIRNPTKSATHRIAPVYGRGL